MLTSNHIHSLDGPGCKAGRDVDRAARLPGIDPEPRGVGSPSQGGPCLVLYGGHR